MGDFGFILFLLVVVFLWNHFVVELLVDGVVNFHKRHHPRNLERQPLKYVLQNQESIKGFIKAFYWIGAGVIVLMILLQ